MCLEAVGFWVPSHRVVTPFAHSVRTLAVESSASIYLAFTLTDLLVFLSPKAFFPPLLHYKHDPVPKFQCKGWGGVEKQTAEYNDVNEQRFIFIVLTFSTTSLKNYQGTLHLSS